MLYRGRGKYIATLSLAILLVPAIALLGISRRTYVVRYDDAERAAYAAGMADGFGAAAHLLRAGVGPRETVAALKHFAEHGVEFDGRIEQRIDHAAIGLLMAWIRSECYQGRGCR